MNRTSMDIKHDRWLRWLLVAIIAAMGIATGALWSASVCRAEPVPQFVPVPQFAPIPKFVEIPVTAEVREKVKETVRKTTKKVRQIIRYEPGACPTCPPTPIYGDVEVPMTPDELKAAAVFEKYQANTLTKVEVDDLKATVPPATIKHVMRQFWSEGSCGMACRSGGSLLYNVYDDGTEEPADEQPAVAPDEGVHSGGGWGGGWRIRGRRR